MNGDEERRYYELEIYTTRLIVYMFCTIRVFITYAYGTYHMRIATRMVRIIVPYAYGAYETPLVYIVSLLRP